MVQTQWIASVLCEVNQYSPEVFQLLKVLGSVDEDDASTGKSVVVKVISALMCQVKSRSTAVLSSDCTTGHYSHQPCWIMCVLYGCMGPFATVDKSFTVHSSD